MEPRTRLYTKDEKKPLNELEQTAIEEFTKLSQEIRTKGLALAETSDEKAKEDKRVFDEIVMLVFEAQTKTEITRRSVTPFNSIEEIEIYFKSLHAKIPAPIHTSAGVLYGNLVANNDPKQALFSEYLTACEQIIKLLFTVKKINTVATNPMTIDTRLKTANDQAQSLLQDHTNKALPPNPVKELAAAAAEWEKNVEIRAGLTSIPRTMDSELGNIAKNFDTYKKQTIANIDTLAKQFETKEKLLQDERKKLVARFNDLTAKVESLTSKIQLLSSIQNELNYSVSSESLSNEFSENAVKNLMTDYYKYTLEIDAIEESLRSNGEASRQAVKEKEQALQQFEAAIDGRKEQFEQDYVRLTTTISQSRQQLIETHKEFTSQAQSIIADLEHPTQRLNAGLKEYPEQNDVLTCLEALSHAKACNLQIEASEQKLNSACRSQTTNWIIWTTAEGAKWRDIGTNVATSLATIRDKLTEYLTSTNGLKNLQPLVKLHEKLIELQNKINKEAQDNSREIEDSKEIIKQLSREIEDSKEIIKQLSRLRQKLMVRSGEYKTTYSILNENLQILESKLNALNELRRYISLAADERRKEFDKLKGTLKDKTYLYFHNDFVRKTVLQPAEITGLRKKLTSLDKKFKKLPEIARGAISVMKNHEAAQFQYEQAVGIYRATLSAVASDLELYTKLSGELDDDKKLKSLLFNARTKAGQAIVNYEAKNITAANEAIDEAHRYISEVKRHTAVIQENSFKKKIQTNLTLLETACDDLDAVKNNRFHGFASKLLGIREFINTCRKQLQEPSTDFRALARETTKQLEAARELQKQALSIDNSDIQMERSSEASQPREAAKTGNFFTRNWRKIVAGGVVGLVGSAVLAGLVFSGVISFGTIPAVILCVSSPFIGAIGVAASAKIIEFVRGEEKTVVPETLASKSIEPVVVSTQASILTDLRNSRTSLAIEPVVPAAPDPVKSLTTSGVVKPGVSSTTVPSTTFPARTSLRNLHPNSFNLSASRRSLRQM